MAGLQVLKKCGKIQNVVSSADFEIFSPEMHTLIKVIWGEYEIYTFFFFEIFSIRLTLQVDSHGSRDESWLG